MMSKLAHDNDIDVPTIASCASSPSAAAISSTIATSNTISAVRHCLRVSVYSSALTYSIGISGRDQTLRCLWPTFYPECGKSEWRTRICSRDSTICA